MLVIERATQSAISANGPPGYRPNSRHNFLRDSGAKASTITDSSRLDWLSEARILSATALALAFGSVSLTPSFAARRSTLAGSLTVKGVLPSAVALRVMAA